MVTKKVKRTKPARKVVRKTRPRPTHTEDFLTDASAAPFPGAHAAGAREEKRTLGTRIREAREMHGLTIEDLSSRSGVSVDELERVEANQTIPPLGHLVHLGKALEMKMGYFLSSGEDQPMCVVRSDSRRMVARHGSLRSVQYGYTYESLACQKVNRVMEPFFVTLEPTDFGEFSSHDGQEFLFVLEGEIRAQVGKQVEVLRAGDAVYYDSTQPHLVKCYGKTPAKILAVIHAGTK
jgi:transcriptional regulator with XRE-family HTH domain